MILRTIKDLPIRAKLLLAFLIVGVLPFVLYFPIELSGNWLRPTFGIDVHIFTLALGLVVSIVMALLFTRLITKPLHLLDKTAREILFGADKQLQVYTNDEIGQVARTFDLLLTNQKQRMREQEESEKRLRYLVEKMGEGLIVADRDETITFVNDKMCEVLGYESNELIGHTIYEFLNETNKAISREKTINRMKGFSEKYELQFVPKSGELVSTIVSAAPLYSDDDSYVGSFAVVMDVTERKRAEETLKKLSSAVGQTADNIFITNRDGIIEYVNPAFEQLTGYTKEEALGKTPRMLKSGKQDQKYYEALWETILSGRVFRTEMVDKKKNGELYYEEKTITPIVDANGNITHFVSTGKDITERKQAEQEREVLYAIGETVNTTASLDELLQSIHHNIKKVMYAENCYIALYDASTETMSFPFFVDQFDPTPAPRAKQRGLTEYVLRTARPLLLTPELLDDLVRNNEVEIIGTLPESWLGVPLFIQSKPIGALVVQSYEQGQKYADIEKYLLVAIGNQTAAAIERKRAQEDLLRSFSLLTATLESTADGILVVDTEGKIVIFNQKYVDMWRISDSIIASRDDNQALAFVLDQLKDPEGFLKKVRELYAQPEAESNDILEFKDGRVFERYSHLQRLAGTTIGQVWSFRDITERRKLEAQFLQSQKLESLGRLAGGIAHDFNNILGIIMGHSSLLERLKADPQKLSQSIEAITKATERGARLVKQLLTFARKTEVLLESVRVNDIIEEIKKLLQETFPKTVTISTSLQQDLPAIVADASQIHQVLLNLCVNARDAMSKRGTLSISTRAIEGESVSSLFPKVTARQYVQIKVADTGIGMDESTRRRIFEPFFTTKDIGKGTGLGLALVFSIVENHNGFIDVQSKLGEGTSFTVYLPISKRALEVSQPARKGVEEIAGGTETILLIEDEEMLSELVKAVLVSKGYTVLTAEDGIKGVKMYKSYQDQIAVVLSDIGLPLLGGQDVVKRIREINPKVKIILASGFIDPEIKSEMYKVGAKHFIQKPYASDEVLRKIREVIDTNL